MTCNQSQKKTRVAATLATIGVTDGSAATRQAASILMRAVEARGETFCTKKFRLESIGELLLGWCVELYIPFSLFPFRKKEVFAQILIYKDLTRFEFIVFNSSLSNDETQKIKDGIAVLEQQFKGQHLV